MYTAEEQLQAGSSIAFLLCTHSVHVWNDFCVATVTLLAFS